nr:ATP-binding cassette domain-containing protein [Brevibacterium casei]
MAIRGRNGSGKSTLLRVLAGVVPPTEGSVLVNGVRPDLRSRAFRQAVASLIGMPPMSSDLTVRDHVTLVASTWFANPEEAEQVATSVMAQLELTPLSTRFPHELSSGQLQLFGVSLVLARPSEVVVIDEPEQRLDDDRLSLVITVLSKLKEKGKTIAVATHSTRLANTLSDVSIDLDSVS